MRQISGVIAAVLLAAGCGGVQVEDADTGWDVEVIADGLEHVWGLSELPSGQLLITERPGRISTVSDGEVTQVTADLDDVQAQGEGGLMGLEISPGFADDRTFFTCYASTSGSVVVVSWELSEDLASADRGEVLVDDLPLNPSGRHSGCRLRIGPDQMLYVGTGDAAMGSNPQDLSSLGGKVLRVDPATGQAPAGNPFSDSEDPQTQLIYSYGHRNVQGLAVQPGTGEIYAVEHGPAVDDEVNLLQAGGNYGWDPVGSGSYDESVSMTDESLDGAVAAVWSSGDSTIATSGAAFLAGEQWGEHEGVLAVAALKGSGLFLVDVAAPEVRVSQAPELDGDYGRLRTVEPAADGGIYVTTSNGSDDQILKVTP